MIGTEAIEMWTSQEYREGVSPNAAARQLCRSLGANGQAPSLKGLLEDMIGEANESYLDYSMAVESIRELVSIIEFMQAGDGSLPLSSDTKISRAKALLPENMMARDDEDVSHPVEEYADGRDFSHPYEP